MAPTDPGQEVTAVNTHTLSHIGDLFRYRLDPHVITALAAGPLRRRDLSMNLQAKPQRYIDDNTQTRSLQRLIQAGLVTTTTQRIGRRDINIYQLTAQGHQLHTAYQSIVTAYENLTAHNGHTASGIRPHHPPSASPPPPRQAFRDGVAQPAGVGYEEHFRGSRLGET